MFMLPHVCVLYFVIVSFPIILHSASIQDTVLYRCGMSQSCCDLLFQRVFLEAVATPLTK